MKIITKEIPIEELIINVKKNLEKNFHLGEKYILISTKDMHNQIKMNLEVFCPKIKSSTLNCLTEKVPNEFDHSIIVIELDSKFVEKKELEQFTQIHKPLLPIVPVHNYDDYDNKDDVGWFLRKIIDMEDNNENLTVNDQDDDFFIDRDGLGMSKVNYNFSIRKSAGVFLEKGIDLQAKGKYDESLKLLKIANTLDKTFFTLFQLASYYFIINNYSRSIKYVENSLKLNNKFSQARFLLGLCFFKVGEFERSITELEQIDKKTVRKRDVLDIDLQLGKMNMMIGNNEKSLKYFKNAEEIVPEKFRSAIINHILFFKYLFHKEVNDYEQCCNVLEVLIKRTPSNSNYLSLLGLSKLMLEKYTESEKYLLESLNIDKQYHYNILPYLAWSYLKQKKYSKALETLKKCLPSKDKIPQDVYSMILKTIQILPMIIEKEEKTQEIMGLTEVLDQIKSKDDNIESIQNDSNQIITRLKNESENSITDIDEFPTVSIEQLRKIDMKCLQILREFVRKKYSGNINLLKDDQDLFSKGYTGKMPFNNYIYKKIEKTLKDRNSTIIEQISSDDLFDCLDFTDFPYIFRHKNPNWDIPSDLISRLHTIASDRNTPAHHSGSDSLGNLGPLDANQHYYTCMQILRKIEEKLKI